MQETAQQYIHRILNCLNGKDPLGVQRATAGKIRSLIRGLTAHQLRQRPAPGKWSIGEIVAHLADAELVVGHRLRMMLRESGAPLQNYDQDFFAGVGLYSRSDPKKSLAQFALLRENNLLLLKSVPKKLWKNYGVHSVRGKETVTRTLSLYAGHDINHLRQIEGIRAKLRGK